MGGKGSRSGKDVSMKMSQGGAGLYMGGATGNRGGLPQSCGAPLQGQCS